jgi:signal transduction histidine kinase
VIGTGIDLTIGLLEFVLALIVLRHTWRLRRGLPWLLPLICFFLLRGVDRSILVFAGEESPTVELLLDLLLVVALLLLLFSMERVVRRLELGRDAARLREAEYRRALSDYRTLARHRLANPVTAIIGSIRALRDLQPRDQALQDELLRAIDREAHRLEQISLDPRENLAAEERGLRPVPKRLK